ncbi:GLIPR1-like protein 1 [Myxocyprinus asiaticus]|uniref:GLIPR1-like protein 1 n=1 Tax=Myxocyprinus asiaticus TaxID=70543 RepID=UPI002223CF64|nr:GLIPR1-like protein 1 [Myxocyprinus asiaticus]
MSSAVHILLFLIVLLNLALYIRTSEPVFNIKDQAFIDECVREHNKHRRNVEPPASNMRYMTWDEGLAITAKAWAKNCIFKHNVNLKQPSRMHPTFKSVGENIWAGAPYNTFKVGSALMLWVNEKQYYNYYNLKCSPMQECGHYTQVVWADTYKVGCAAQACPNGVSETSFSSIPGIIFVCNYATAGNYRSVPPYKNGSPCSMCNNEMCDNQLCRNSTRDTLMRYNLTTDWSSCGSFCQAVLITRPVSVLLIFAIVYGLQHHYTHLFAYE